jgi:integrase
LPTSGLHERLQAAISLLLATGARVGELTKAQWKDIDLDAKTWSIPVKNSKNGRAHLIHLSAFALAQVDVMLGFRSGTYVLAGRNGDVGLADRVTASKLVYIQ